MGYFAGPSAKTLYLKYVLINSESIKKKNVYSMQCFVYEMNFSQFMLSENNIYTILLCRHNELRNEFIFLFGDGVSPEKKMTETSSLRVAHDAKFPSFFSGDSSIIKQNK
jgi:hypothetical protein